nr:hypothetical protein GCM10020093_047890 [Planobispora longispora]
MKRTVTRLADGRELIYFDRDDDADRGAVDERPLPPRPPASELRYDPLTEEWIAVAGHRQGRTFLPPADECPLCPSAPGRLTEIPSAAYDVVVFENRFPSFSDRPVDLAPPGGLSESRPGAGRCEVVCFTSDHGSSFSTLSPTRSDWSWRRGSTARRSCRRCRAWSRSSASRTGARRSASRWPIRTARSTPTPT